MVGSVKSMRLNYAMPLPSKNKISNEKSGTASCCWEKKYCFNEHWKYRRLDRRHQSDLAKAVEQYCNKSVLLVSTVIKWQLLGARAAIISFCKRTVPYKPWNRFWFKLAWSFWANSFRSLSYSLVLCNQLPCGTDFMGCLQYGK